MRILAPNELEDYHLIMSTKSVLKEVRAEREAQEAKWGEQNHPWAGPEPKFEGQIQTPWTTWIEQPTWKFRSQQSAKDAVALMTQEGTLGYCDILMEEIYEVLDEADIQAVRTELIQIAAVAVAAVESIDRNGR